MAAAEREIRAVDGVLSMADAPAKEGYLELLYRWYPVVVLAHFILTALVSSVRSSGTTDDDIAPAVRGPGGKPLPLTKKKTRQTPPPRLSQIDLVEIGPRARFTFQLLAITLTATLFMNAMAIAIHTWQANPDLLERGSQMKWWCGEPMVVSSPIFFFCPPSICLFSLAKQWHCYMLLAEP